MSVRNEKTTDSFRKIRSIAVGQIISSWVTLHSRFCPRTCLWNTWFCRRKVFQISSHSLRFVAIVRYATKSEFAKVRLRLLIIPFHEHVILIITYVERMAYVKTPPGRYRLLTVSINRTLSGRTVPLLFW